MMEATGAILFLPRENGSEPPLLFEPLLFCPAAVWLRQALLQSGAAHFFVVCHGDDRETAAALFPQGTELVTLGAQNATQALRAFLDRCGGRVRVVTRPVFLLPAGRLTSPPPGDPGLWEMDAAALAAALDEAGDFESCLRGHEADRGGYLTLTRQSWAAAEAFARRLTVQRLMESGVRAIDPESVYVDPTVTIGPGTRLLPGVILRGDTVIGRDCELGPHTVIRDCTVGDGVTVNASQLNESTVEDGATVGPFAYIRPHCHVGKGVKVGDFVELKNSVIGDGTKISHLTYVGDSDVGSRVNFGCGTVTVNYDGAAKFRTTIGDGAFLGCNTNLVAPVKIGAGAYTAAGSTITDDVPDDSLGIARSPQTIKVQWAAKRRSRKGKK